MTKLEGAVVDLCGSGDYEELTFGPSDDTETYFFIDGPVPEWALKGLDEEDARKLRSAPCIVAHIWSHNCCFEFRIHSRVDGELRWARLNRQHRREMLEGIRI